MELDETDGFEMEMLGLEEMELDVLDVM